MSVWDQPAEHDKPLFPDVSAEELQRIADSSPEFKARVAAITAALAETDPKRRSNRCNCCFCRRY